MIIADGWDWDCILIQGALYRARGGRGVVQGMVMLVSIFVYSEDKDRRLTDGVV